MVGLRNLKQQSISEMTKMGPFEPCVLYDCSLSRSYGTHNSSHTDDGSVKLQHIAYIVDIV